MEAFEETLKYLLTGFRAGVYCRLEWEKVDENGHSINEPDLTHVPVLAEEILGSLPRREHGIYVDCTVGYAGLASLLLERFSVGCRFIGLDRDAAAIEAAARRLQPFGTRVTLMHENFSHLRRCLDVVGVSGADAVILDLGVSSPQLDCAERGFSFMYGGPLDMRMDQRERASAADVVNRFSERELADAIFLYGEERYARRIARAIVRAREEAPLRTTDELVSAIRRAVPPGYRHGRLHFATRTFQALRIVVNRELDALRDVLPQALDSLTLGGRMAVVSFHSLEDRLVKHTFREWSQAGKVQIVTKKPIEASEEECASNPRARSAKLRVAERLS